MRDTSHSIPGGGRLSTGFAQPVGRNFEPGSLGGYYIDLKVKATSPEWPPPELLPLGSQLWVEAFQWGLGCHERWLEGEGDGWLDGAIGAGEHALGQLAQGGSLTGGFLHDAPYPHTFRLRPPWLSGMAQGQGASLLARLGRATGEQRFNEGARSALAPMRVPSREGGVRAYLDDVWVLEEYPTDPPSFVLNGAIFALWGLLDAALALDDQALRDEFEEGVSGLASELHRWDTGRWSRYDLFPHAVTNVASSAYHELHIDQLRALHATAQRPELNAMAERFERYGSSRLRRSEALARKVLFRLAVPRNRMLARVALRRA